MKKDREPIADLYIRVSTDEQADKGYSQRNQEEMLRKYCDNHSIEIRNVIYEDHSAKSFNRPEWKKLIQQLKKNRNRIDLILFTKWDRFSRNAGDAYQMINVLRDLNVEPQAIEQPLDLSIPENKMMLAFYLAAPEVENDRRALNVFYGMRRAKKEGRYMGLAPVGYKNKVDETGNKYIAPKQPDASILLWAFEHIGKGAFNTAQIWKKAKDKGLRCSKNAFWQLIRNPLYCGKIFIPRFKDEESYFVEGQHEAIISEELFDRVQDVLDGRGRKYRPKIETQREFPLKGFLVCPECGKLLTASKSRGRSRHYTYYHCYRGCSHRINSDRITKAFDDELKKYVPKKEILDIYHRIVSETYYEMTSDIQVSKKQLLGQINEYEKRMSHIRDLLATDKIEASDYNDFKAQYSSTIEQLNVKVDSLNANVPCLDGLLSSGLEDLMRLDKILGEGNNEDVRAIVNMIYPDKLTFNGNVFLMGKVNVALSYSYHHLK
ncbi:MAG: recombinase family protein [Terrimonas ferruginea]|uniref:recombinase family protein n=1 Tax=Terrimonas ferruginea TaxID=249 RepID=UPI00092A0318|nr:recombinase family protein [Terrimonas ferruginea]MBN8784291.1 recombinase family protein [Terrimonas ferruginea]MBX3242236.1 recombinase family protein [Chitinophagaceae bacterium]MCW5928163.1 recombinase family protein [Chitinophagaceae bacterium]OJW45733.1 MAG: recombinase family protein [Sphingobacteriales bacterium 48-107]